MRKNSPGLRPCGVLDLQYWSFGCLVGPPYPPSGHLGPRMSTVKACHGALGGSFFNLFIASIEFDFGHTLDPCWARRGSLLAVFWVPKSDQVGTKMCLEVLFVVKCKFSCGPTYVICSMFLLPFFDPKTGPRSPQDRPKTAPRAITK